MSSLPDSRQSHYVLRLSVRSICSFIHQCVRSVGQILLPWYLMNCLSILKETYKEYSLTPADDLIRFWRSKVKVTASRQGGEGITSKFTF